MTQSSSISRSSCELSQLSDFGRHIFWSKKLLSLIHILVTEHSFSGTTTSCSYSFVVLNSIELKIFFLRSRQLYNNFISNLNQMFIKSSFFLEIVLLLARIQFVLPCNMFRPRYRIPFVLFPVAVIRMCTSLSFIDETLFPQTCPLTIILG